MWVGVCIVTMLVSTVALASQIVPADLETPGGFGPGHAPPPGCHVIWDAFNGQAIECDLAVPTNATQLIGWAGYMLDFSAFFPSAFSAPGYMSTEVWHDGGTPHLLDQPHWPAGVWTLAPVFYPAGDGHKCVAGDRVFARFWCVGFSTNPRPPLCAAQLIGHFRVSD